MPVVTISANAREVCEAEPAEFLSAYTTGHVVATVCLLDLCTATGIGAGLCAFLEVLNRLTLGALEFLDSCFLCFICLLWSIC